MKLEIYAIRDRATDQYMNPMFMLTTGQATRLFTDQVNKDEPNNDLNKHPDDYDLYHLGTYDTNTGTFDTKTPEMVAIGKNVKQ